MSTANLTPRVLIVDDESSVRFTLSEILHDHGIESIEAADGREAMKILRADGDSIALIVSDLKMPEMNGFELMHEVGTLADAPPFLMITAHGDERAAVEAIKRGAVDYFKKPFDTNEIVTVIRRNLRTATLESRLRGRTLLGQNMLFSSPAMAKLAERVAKVAGKDVAVLISGESGTGKELVADALVRGSSRRDSRFVRFNCGALHGELAQAELFGHSRGAFTGAERARVGLFREADGGTLLLDEVNSLESSMQALLLRVLQEKEVRPVGQDRAVPIDVRIIATSNRPLRDHPTFRQDLYFRLCVVHLAIPPLRDRREEIPILARHFARLYGEHFGVGAVEIHPSTMARLQVHDWPGNVRELQHTIQSLVALADGTLIAGDPFDESTSSELTPPTSGLKSQVDAYEAKLIGQMLVECEGNQSAAARRLEINRATLISKLKKYGL